MLPYKLNFATLVPRTLDVRIKIAEAIQTLIAHENDESLRRRRANLASARRELGAIRLALQELRRDCDPRLRSHVLKYNPDQPRISVGNPDGGQWTSEDDGAPSGSSTGNDSGPNPGAQYVAAESENAANDNLTAEQVCRKAYSDAVALARMDLSLSQSDYLKIRRESAVSLDDCLNLASEDLPISPKGDFVFFMAAG